MPGNSVEALPMGDASFADGDTGNTRKPACDNCKIRKTKCNRGSPCSSCTAAKRQCRITRKTPEKRQRVLLSKRYDEAMENVSSQLGELQNSMQELVESSRRSRTSPSIIGVAQASPSTNLGIDTPDLSAVSEGYKGDSSFHAHMKDVTSTLEWALNGTRSSRLGTPSAMVKNLILDIDGAESIAAESGGPSTNTISVRFPELENMPMPPVDAVIKLLQLARIEKQRFFADQPFVDQDDLSEECKSVYFATNPYSLWTWITVNMGLLFLFMDLEERHYSRIGLDAQNIESVVKSLTVNADSACSSLRLIAEPLVSACRAIALLGVFCVKTGRNVIAWRVQNAAARMCLDLGLHRMPKPRNDARAFRTWALFRHVYAWDQAMALTNGRMASIRQEDVLDTWSDVQDEYPGIPGMIYSAFIEWCTVAGEIHLQLFSLSAQKETLQTRVQRAKSLAQKLLSMQKALRTSNHGDPEKSEPTFRGALRALDVTTYGFIALVYRIIPPWQSDSHPLQCCDECVDAARKSLTMLVEVGEHTISKKPIWWSLFLNMTMCLVPFVSFIVIVGHTIAMSSSEDLPLLCSVVAMIESAAEHTPATQKLYRVCQRFYKIAELIVLQQAESMQRPLDMKDLGGMAEEHFPMSQHDWDMVMQGFDLEFDGLDASAMANLVEPYMTSEPV